ncbi:MAG: SRPBCC family protein [Prochloraceae cyanobacterium]
MIFNFSSRLIKVRGRLIEKFSLFKTYRTLSTASVDVLWQKLIDLTDVSWHPLFSRTNAPFGLMAKPGLIYKVVTRLTPIPVRIFVEQVSPKEVLSVRILTIPGIQQKITYQVESTLRGTYISYSVTLRGWWSPVLWCLIKSHSAKVVSELAKVAESNRVKKNK